MEKIFAKKLRNLLAIPDGNYEGYYWVSDAKSPQKIVSSADLAKMKEYIGNPFIMEALLYDRQGNRSIHVQHTGVHHVAEYDWNSFDDTIMVSDPKDVEVFLPQKIEGVKGLNFSRVWKKESDPLCEGKEVLKMYAIVFTGFKN